MSNPKKEGQAVAKVGHRCRVNYFVKGDIVWIRPVGLPFWPAEVCDADEHFNRVRATLIDPPPSELLKANLKQEESTHNAYLKKLREKLQHFMKRRKSEAGQDVHETIPTGGESDPQVLHLESELEKAEKELVTDSIVTSNGLKVYFFDKLYTPEEVEEAAAHRLRRESHDVSAYEAFFYKSVLHANRLVRTVFSPEKLKPYVVCGVGVVHSLMRAHVDAPRQPNTNRFEPQTALIRLRSGLENALRDLQGFEYIWVLFQFSYAAAMATGEGQQSIQELSEAEKAAPAETPPTVGDTIRGDPLSAWRHRDGITRSTGYKVMIVPPRDEEQRGVFATRSPHRPNFIGMSCVRLVAVRGLDVFIADHDLLHGTPVLDIKPYLPFCDAHPDAKAGWVQALDASGRGKTDHKYEKQATRVDRILEEEKP
ncbi:hypothetical protein AGDE_08562 [Angomonas deanei]|uniref:tRNA-methyltransferase O, putative n=1 Tax=Angomonas deanei TaxID=59799 RepID=A0A7G2CEX7_9TRYP|nr:hypothetical protein AGDE_08562 [Angomonas deanei]CAD2218370.1 tRNA-methyltransferase O, putative [Angomonas deanei]|eukprot:EPY32571.1 hypothetical protein AGDE_08562 [Angomonas deanei]